MHITIKALLFVLLFGVFLLYIARLDDVSLQKPDSNEVMYVFMLVSLQWGLEHQLDIFHSFCHNQDLFPVSKMQTLHYHLRNTNKHHFRHKSEVQTLYMKNTTLVFLFFISNTTTKIKDSKENRENFKIKWMKHRESRANLKTNPWLCRRNS